MLANESLLVQNALQLHLSLGLLFFEALHIFVDLFLLKEELLQLCTQICNLFVVTERVFELSSRDRHLRLGRCSDYLDRGLRDEVAESFLFGICFVLLRQEFHLLHMCCELRVWYTGSGHLVVQQILEAFLSFLLLALLLFLINFYYGLRRGSPRLLRRCTIFRHWFSLLWITLCYLCSTVECVT